MIDCFLFPSRQVLAHVRTIPELILLGSGSQNVKRLPIFSFMVRHPRGTFLHHNFVCAVLNDVFGIQARGGCACAGRYAHDLMGIDQELATEYQKALVDGYEIRNSLRRYRFRRRPRGGRDSAAEFVPLDIAYLCTRLTVPPYRLQGKERRERGGEHGRFEARLR